MRHELCKLPSGRLSGTRRIYINHLLEWLQRHAYVRKCLKYEKTKKKKRKERNEEKTEIKENVCLAGAKWHFVVDLLSWLVWKILHKWFIILICVLWSCVLSKEWKGGYKSKLGRYSGCCPLPLSLSLSLSAAPFLLPCPTNFNRKWRKTFQKSWKTFTANLACPRLACSYPPAHLYSQAWPGRRPKGANIEHILVWHAIITESRRNCESNAKCVSKFKHWKRERKTDNCLQLRG